MRKDDLSQWLSYDPDTGVVRWKTSPKYNVPVGCRAGCVTAAGYRRIKFKGRGYMEHRVAWLLHTGEWPFDQLDHINGNRGENMWLNLREATRRENLQNGQVHRNGRLPGAKPYKNTGRWISNIKIDGILIHLGYFDTELEAHKAYMKEARHAHSTDERN